MNKFIPLSILLCTIVLESFAQSSTSGSKKEFDYITHNRILEKVVENGKSIVRFSEAQGPGIAWIKDIEFSEGIIEFDVKGRDVLQKSFIGIAFHGVDNENYETVFFRPFNFQSTDSVRKIHAVQYAFLPKFDFQQLRKTRKDEFETAIKPSDVNANDWFHVKIEITGTKISTFVNGYKEPCLAIVSLNTNGVGKKIGFWVGNNSNGDFANLTLSKK